MSYLFVRHNHRFKKIEFADIRYVEANANYVRIVTAAELYLVFSTLHQVEAALPPTQFIRIHRSFIVGIAHIEAFDNHCVYLHGKELPVSITWFPRLLAQLPILATSKPQVISRSPRKPARRPAGEPEPTGNDRNRS